MGLRRLDWWSGWAGDAPHVRDPLTVRAVSRGFGWALLPCVLVGLYLVGREGGSTGIQDGMTHGLVQLAPVFGAAFVAGLGWQWVFATVRQRPVSSGLFVTAVIVTLALPPTVPPWQVAVAVSFGVVLAQEVFGGTGMNIVHPALVALSFLALAWPAQLRGEGVPTSAVGGELPLSLVGPALGAALLLARGLVCWRVLVGGLLAVGVVAAVSSGVSGALPPAWRQAPGVFVFGLVFVATDPATSATTPVGRWVHGAASGLLAMLLASTTPAGPRAVFPALLLASLAAPSIDHVVVQLNVRRRRRRCRHA